MIPQLSSSPRLTLAKPKALSEGARVGVFSPSSPGDESKLQAGIAELKKLGFDVQPGEPLRSEGYFAGAAKDRFRQFVLLAQRDDVSALFASRGGYGSTYLNEMFFPDALNQPKIVIGHSDLTSLQSLLANWYGWITFYGPMVAAGFHAGDGEPHGYDRKSLLDALTTTRGGWNVGLRGEALVSGSAEGIVAGGAMTLVEATFKTPWEVNTEDAILLLEDRAMKPYQIDRVLMHFKQAGKLKNVRGIVLGEFPECEPPVPGSPTVREVCERILAPLKIPIVYGAAVGHTPRPMLTIPLGIRARLRAEGQGTLEFLEPAVTK